MRSLGMTGKTGNTGIPVGRSAADKPEAIRCQVNGSASG
jgi:hypothetical protein